MDKLSLFNLEKIIDSINKVVGGGNFVFNRVQLKESKSHPFIHRLEGLERESTGKYRLMNNGKKAGYLFFEKGKVSDESDNFVYEQIKLCLFPVKLKQGGKMPKSTIKIYVEDVYDVLVERRDHAKKYLFWKKTDLSSIFPVDCFLYESVSRRIVKR